MLVNLQLLRSRFPLLRLTLLCNIRAATNKNSGDRSHRLLLDVNYRAYFLCKMWDCLVKLCVPIRLGKKRLSDIPSLHPSFHGLLPVGVHCIEIAIMCLPAESMNVFLMLSSHSRFDLPLLDVLFIMPYTTFFTSLVSSIQHI